MDMTHDYYSGEESERDRFYRLLKGSLEKISLMIGIQVGPEIAEQIIRKGIRIAMKNFDRLKKDEQFYFWLYRIITRVHKRMKEQSESGPASDRKHPPK